MNVAIIGCGKSGAAARNLLNIKGISAIDIYDNNASLGFRPIDEFKDDYDMAVVSPGIDRTKYKNLPKNITSEIELAYEFMAGGAKILAVTGTNGKSTVTHLTAQILNNDGVKAAACGNIGLPFAEAVLESDTEVFVTELSSFQIELLNDFKAAGACIINITPDHLDRYGNMDNYVKAKLRLMKFTDENGLFVCGSDRRIYDKAGFHHFRTVIVDEAFKKYPRLEGDRLDFGDFWADVSKFPLFGRHNVVNLSFALLLASSVKKMSGDVTPCIENLTGMPHRTELVGEFGGIRWIDDSKGTNVDSVITALSSVSKPSWLLIGGRDKKSDYTVLKDLINKNVTGVCYFGEAALLIKAQLENIISVRQETFSSLENAVVFCASEAESGSTVLLSPACSSFDEFENYEVRGEKFAEYVIKYAGKGK